MSRSLSCSKSFRSLARWIPLLALQCCWSGLPAQQQTSVPSPSAMPDRVPIEVTPDHVRDLSSPHDPKNPLADPDIEARLGRIRAKEQQKRIVEDANRLVSLTALYRKALEEHGSATEQDGKLLLQIEKLAREVEVRMKGM